VPPYGFVRSEKLAARIEECCRVQTAGVPEHVLRRAEFLGRPATKSALICGPAGSESSASSGSQLADAHQLAADAHPAGNAGLDRAQARVVTNVRQIDLLCREEVDQRLIGLPRISLTIHMNDAALGFRHYNSLKNFIRARHWPHALHLLE